MEEEDPKRGVVFCVVHNFFVMCGIVAYQGDRPAKEVLVKGLKRLEYRGYDSAGIGVVTAGGKVEIVKKVGKVVNLDNAVEA